MHTASGAFIEPEGRRENLDHIVRCVNAHEALVEALEAAAFALKLHGGKAEKELEADCRKALAAARGEDDE